MPKKNHQEIKEKLEYIGLDLENIPNSIQEFTPLDFRITKSYDESKNRQYRYVPIKEIQIMLCPNNRLDPLEDKYKKAMPISSYLLPETEDDIMRHTTFLNMLRQVKIEEIEKVEKEQKELNKKIPFKVKYTGNYLWQIYYSENTDQYFMLVPIEDSDYSTFFYLLKKQLEKGRSGKVFVPIRHVEYSKKYLKKTEFEDLENYLWLFTKDWPLVYEVYDKNGNLSIQIIGETEVYEKIKTTYKIVLEEEEQASKFYKLLKALFILQTEAPKYYKFQTNLDKQGNLEFWCQEEKIEYENLANYIKEQCALVETLKQTAEQNIGRLKEKLEKLKEITVEFEASYLAKEKQITTYLECKRSFFGKVKYFFKYSKKSGKEEIGKDVEKILEEEIQEKKIEKEEKEKIKKRADQKNHTLDELIRNYQEYEIQENEVKNLVLDINALKLKNKNMKTKIENAMKYIEEIDQHKKSIFEFWKYSNKDEISTLPEGEEEEFGVEKKITKKFDYQEDLEKLGKTWDKMQRKNLSQEELDSLYITTTDVLELLNQVKLGEVEPKEIEKSLKKLKEEAKKEKDLFEKEEFDIFGGIIDDHTKVKKLANKKHREVPKDKFKILDISKGTRQLGYKLTLEKIVEEVQRVLKNQVIKEPIPIYKAFANEKINHQAFNIFELNPEKELEHAIRQKQNKINLYRIQLGEETNAIAYTNILFFDNKNRTLPIGMDLSSNILIDTSEQSLKLKQKSTFRMIDFEEEKSDFSKLNVKTVCVYEYEVQTKKDKK